VRVFFVPNFKCFLALRSFDRLAFLILFLRWKKDEEKRGSNNISLSKILEKHNFKPNKEEYYRLYTSYEVNIG